MSFTVGNAGPGNSMTFALTLTLAALTLVPGAPAQTPTPLDPARGLPASPPPRHTPLPEQYLWTANDVTTLRRDHARFPWNRPDLRIAPHFFRVHFTLGSVPSRATLYLAGPREAQVFLNGQPVQTFDSNADAPIGFQVFHVDLAAFLHLGDNVLAIEAIRGRGIVAATGSVATQQLAYGEILAARLIAAPCGAESPTVLISTPAWRSSTVNSPHWADPAFDDSAWLPAQSLGPIESNPDFFQWNADAGMYAWPGYLGLSPSLRTLTLPAVAATHIFPGPAAFSPAALSPAAPSLAAFSPAAFSGPNPLAAPFTVTLAPASATDAEAPSLLLDFGREIAGRLLVESASTHTAILSIAYGESELEALATSLTPGQQGGNYLGTNLLELPPNGIARGPKSAFRYIRIRFLRGDPTLALRSIRAEAIFYPVDYAGSFTSSDPVLNRIWETSAYTAHLAEQDGIWDAPKRDRGLWAGDLDIEAPVLLTVFGDPALLEDTLRRIAQATPPGAHVDGIPSYTALWITTLATLYQHTGDRAFLISQHANLLRFLARMDADIGPDNLLLPTLKPWGFVDWSPGLFGHTPETRIGTDLQYIRGYTASTQLLQALGETSNAARTAQQVQDLTTAARAWLDDGTLGLTWQLNTLAVLTHISTNPAPIWSQVLAHVKQDAPADQTISPYFNAYLLDAMSALGHRQQALAWLRTYWSGMLDEGATSFWEAYDLRWPKHNFALSLQADGTSGFFVSLAHGWSSGPAVWLAENVLGITPETPGYASVSIRPNLLGLTFARGSVATPHGSVAVSIDPHAITLDLPPGVRRARITPPSGSITAVDGRPCPPAVTLVLATPGHHVLEYR